MAHADRNRFSKCLPALLVVLLASGCLHSPLDTGGSGDTAGGAEKEQAYYLVTSVGLEAIAWGVRESQGPGGAGQVSTVSYSSTRKCEYGGTVSSTGQVTTQTDVDPARAIVDTRTSDVHQGCVLLVGRQRVTITGSPGLTTTVHAASRAGQLWGTQSVDLAGTFSWAGDNGAGGRCKVNVSIYVADGSQTTSGDACGYHVDITVPTS